MDWSPGTASPNLVRSPGFQRRRREAQTPAPEPTAALSRSPGGVCFSRCPGIRATPHKRPPCLINIVNWQNHLGRPHTGPDWRPRPCASLSLGRGDPAAGGRVCARQSSPWEADLRPLEETEAAAARVPSLPGDHDTAAAPSPLPVGLGPPVRRTLTPSLSFLDASEPQTHAPDGRSPAGPSGVGRRPGLSPPAAASHAGRVRRRAAHGPPRRTASPPRNLGHGQRGRPRRRSLSRKTTISPGPRRAAGSSQIPRRGESAIATGGAGAAPRPGAESRSPAPGARGRPTG